MAKKCELHVEGHTCSIDQTESCRQSLPSLTRYDCACSVQLHVVVVRTMCAVDKNNARAETLQPFKLILGLHKANAWTLTRRVNVLQKHGTVWICLKCFTFLQKSAHALGCFHLCCCCCCGDQSCSLCLKANVRLYKHNMLDPLHVPYCSLLTPLQ